MIHVTLALCLVVTVTDKNLNYEQGFEKAEREKKPLMIFIGARWCASCQVMKRDTIGPMQESGDLKELVFVYIDKDERPELAEQLMKGETLPQVVIFNKEKDWKRFSLTGTQDKLRIGELLKKVFKRK
jgi:thioredoxin-like negative regulator of GroEL